MVGPGRAGLSLARALSLVPGRRWRIEPVLGRHDELGAAARDVDLLVLAVPDEAVPEVARAVEPVTTTVVAHLAGSLDLDALAPHPHRASLHPLIPLPDPDLGARRLRAGGTSFAVAAGDAGARAVVEAVVADLAGHAVAVADEDRVLYHAAACMASNHLVALLGQVERVAALAGVPFEAYLELVRATLDNVSALGPAAALTGPVARGDFATVAAHLVALSARAPEELAAYEALAEAARRLVPTRESACV
ncbi:MAG: DUF2520 domain-containing protein [Acidimicrobiales bacterium]